MNIPDTLSLHWLDQAPAAGNLLFFDQRNRTVNDRDPQHEEILKKELEERTREYRQYIEKKSRRPFVDIYASFQPFNESTRALMPFLALAQKQLVAGDRILVLWDRSGWLTSLVSGMFPEQQVVTTWEGNKDVLGYAGYHYWYQHSERNHIVFCEHDAAFPFPDQNFSLIIGLDFLHRYDQRLTMKECLRLVDDQGAIVFPHVHLNNSEPEPYFDRGGHQLHGRDYQKLFDRISEKKDLKGFIFSELELFRFNEGLTDRWEWQSTPDMKDYNALAALLPARWIETPLTPYTISEASFAAARILKNPLLNVKGNKVTIDYSHLNGQVGYLLDRHIPYLPRISKADGFTLNDMQMKLLYWADRSLTMQEIAQKTKHSLQDIREECRVLHAIGLTDQFTIGKEAHRQQNFIGSQQLFIPYEEQTFAQQWKNALSEYGERPLLINEEDGSEISFEECHALVLLVAARLKQSGVRKGDRVVLVAPIHSEALLIAWACLHEGYVLVPVNYKTGAKDMTQVLSLVKPALIFSSQHVAPETYGNEATDIIGLDEDVDTVHYPLFSEWMEREETVEEPPVPLSEQDAAIVLFSSGSTGTPKGILLSQGHAIRSAQLMAKTYDWTVQDRFLAIGGLDTMSGFRNACLVPLFSGASVVVPSFVTIQHTLALAECIKQKEVTILAANPSLYHQFNKLHHKLQHHLDSVRKALCTGSRLSVQVSEEFKKLYGKPIYNYYGLTETSGICSADLLNDTTSSRKENSIGIPVGALMQVVDQQGQVLPMGEIGELRVYGENVFEGYYRNEEQTQQVKKDGWFYTGDLAFINEEGEVLLMGRTREMVKTNTDTLVFLEPIGELLMTHAKVEQAAVVAYREDETERMAAFVVCKEEELQGKQLMQELKQFVEQAIGKDRTPDLIFFRKELPLTSNGKVLKQQLTDEVYAHRGITP